MKGTTPTHMRPIRVIVEIPNVPDFIDVNMVETLFNTGMSQSKAEAKRLIEQNLIWLDDGMDEGSIWDRLRKIKLEQSKFLLIEDGDVICIGKSLDDAVCHRIIFERGKQLLPSSKLSIIFSFFFSWFNWSFFRR